jgi:hypothetical protein
MDIRTDPLITKEFIDEVSSNIAAYRKEITWSSKNGDVYTLADLNSGHLINIIKLIIRTRTRVEILPVLKAELNYRNNLSKISIITII